jgi:hypothetical protein
MTDFLTRALRKLAALARRPDPQPAPAPDPLFQLCVAGELPAADFRQIIYDPETTLVRYVNPTPLEHAR